MQTKTCLDWPSIQLRKAILLMKSNSSGTEPRIEHRGEISPEIISNIIIYFKDSQTIKRAGDQIYEFDPKKLNNSDLNLITSSVLKTLNKYISENNLISEITLGIKNLFDTNEGHECAYTVIFIEGKDSKRHLANLKELACKIAHNAVKADDLLLNTPSDISLHDDIKSTISSHISSKSGSIIKRPFSFGSDLNNEGEEYTCKRFQTVTEQQVSSDRDEYELLARPNGFNVENNKIYCTLFSENSTKKSGQTITLKCIDPMHFKVIASAYLDESIINCKIKRSKNPNTNSLENILISVALASTPSPDEFELEHQ